MKYFLGGLIIGMALTATISFAHQVGVSAQVEENPCNSCIESCRNVCSND